MGERRGSNRRPFSKGTWLLRLRPPFGDGFRVPVLSQSRELRTPEMIRAGPFPYGAISIFEVNCLVSIEGNWGGRRGSTCRSMKGGTRWCALVRYSRNVENKQFTDCRINSGLAHFLIRADFVTRVANRRPAPGPNVLPFPQTMRIYECKRRMTGMRSHVMRE